jgi:hypothetical protein
MRVIPFSRSLVLGLIVYFASVHAAEAKEVELHVKPSLTDTSIFRADSPHTVMYNTDNKSSNLLIFLSGAGGDGQAQPAEFFKTVVAQGYRLIALSYIELPSVSQVCATNVGDPNCAEKLRRKRCFGNDLIGLIPDSPADSIVNRTTKLIEYLAKSDPTAGWGRYVTDGVLKWSMIAFAGQAQGGGMAAFIAKLHPVARVIMFSGGWDTAGTTNSIASWYKNVAETSANRWYATYHVLEPNAKTLCEVYRTLAIPESHILVLHERVPKGTRAHPQGVNNTLYRRQWLRVLGSGNS